MSRSSNKINKIPFTTICKCIVISSLFFYVLYIVTMYPFSKKCELSTQPTTNISHIMFVLVGSVPAWGQRKSYIESWWRPNTTRGNIWLDTSPTRDFLPWSSASPPYKINEDVTRLKTERVDPVPIRMYHSILETYRLGQNEDVRWYVMGDDDSVIFVDNLVEMLGKYDHNKYYYIGKNSECVMHNFWYSFDMGYGGAGYALSYGLVEALVPRLEDCIERYGHLPSSDFLSQVCLADLGVDLTIEKGLHQIDLQGDISGLLSAHPKDPILSLHHLDLIDPIFPSRNRSESIKHLMKPANMDPSRMLQQTICYDRHNNWTFSVSWGYSVYVYQSILPRSLLRLPIETFKPLNGDRAPAFIFPTRRPSDQPCEAPHVFSFENIDHHQNMLLTSYVRTTPLPESTLCPSSLLPTYTTVRVLSPANVRKQDGETECCDVEYVDGEHNADVKLRACMKAEMLA